MAAAECMIAGGTQLSIIGQIYITDQIVSPLTGLRFLLHQYPVLPHWAKLFRPFGTPSVTHTGTISLQSSCTSRSIWRRACSSISAETGGPEAGATRGRCRHWRIAIMTNARPIANAMAGKL